MVPTIMLYIAGNRYKDKYHQSYINNAFYEMVQMFIPDSISTPQGAYSLAAHWCTEPINSLIHVQCPHCPHCTIFSFFDMEEQWKWTCPRPSLWQIQPGFKPMIFWSLVQCLIQLCHSGHYINVPVLCNISLLPLFQGSLCGEYKVVLITAIKAESALG